MSKPQSQASVLDQMEALWPIANREGLYDAADFIRGWIDAHPVKGDPPKKIQVREYRREDGLRLSMVGDEWVIFCKAGIEWFYDPGIRDWRPVHCSNCDVFSEAPRPFPQTFELFQTLAKKELPPCEEPS
jgi:hypothetical protein